MAKEKNRRISGIDSEYSETGTFHNRSFCREGGDSFLPFADLVAEKALQDMHLVKITAYLERTEHVDGVALYGAEVVSSPEPCRATVDWESRALLEEDHGSTWNDFVVDI